MTPNNSPAGWRVHLVLHTFDRGGSGRVAAYLAGGFADREMDVTLTLFATGGPVEELATQLAGPRPTVRYLGRSSGNRPLDLIRGFGQLFSTFRRERPDVVIAAANNVALVTALAFRLAGLHESRLFVKTTNPIASSRHKGFVRFIRRLSYSLIFRWTSGVWTLSPEESEEMREAFPAFTDQFQDVCNPYVTPEMFVDPALSEPQSAKTVIAVARLDTQKRLERLITAFAQVRTPGARLLILGEGDQRTKLADLVQWLDLGDCVSMPGYVDNVAAALHAAHVSVLTSDYEGLPAVVLEAMAANCAVLSTDCFPAARSLVGATEGCAIIESTEPAQLAALIDDHLCRPKPRHLSAVAERFSIENGMASHVDALLRKDANSAEHPGPALPPQQSAE